MTDYLRIARAEMPDLKTAVTSPEYARAESPKIEAEADQVELERAGARISYMFARKKPRPARWRLRQNKAASISSYPSHPRAN